MSQAPLDKPAVKLTENMAEDGEVLTHEQLIERLRTGWQLFPNTPGLREAACELMRPVIEGMRGKEIIYRCRVPWLIRIDELTVDDRGFSAVSTPLQEIRDGPFSMPLRSPFEFSAAWIGLHMNGTMVKMNMITDCFYPDQAVVSAIKSAAARGATTKEIQIILNRALDKRYHTD
jgi:hypothetical protein